MGGPRGGGGGRLYGQVIARTIYGATVPPLSSSTCTPGGPWPSKQKVFVVMHIKV